MHINRYFKVANIKASIAGARISHDDFSNGPFRSIKPKHSFSVCKVSLLDIDLVERVIDSHLKVLAIGHFFTLLSCKVMDWTPLEKTQFDTMFSSKLDPSAILEIVIAKPHSISFFLCV